MNSRASWLALALLCVACSPAAPEAPAPGPSEPSTPAEPTQPAPPPASETPPPPPAEVSCPPADSGGPAAPRIQSPTLDDAWTVPERLLIRTTAPSGLGGGERGLAQFEIWSEKDRRLQGLVWSARVGEPATLTEARLADGDFLVGGGRLVERAYYAIRVRHASVSATCGERWGAWSEPRFFRAEDASHALFEEGEMLDFHLDIPKASWDAMNAEAVPPRCARFERHSYRATLRVGDQVFEDVGVHVKGGCGSARSLEGKASFNVDLDWDDPAVAGCPASRELFGRKHFTLNNNVQDPSAMNELLGYPLYRALGVPAPRAAPVRLFVNGALWGLYTHVESIDRRFLARWFEDKDGPLYEGSYWCDLVPGNVPDRGGAEKDSCFERKLEGDACDGGGGTGDAWAPLRTLTQRLQALPKGGFYPEVQAFFDYDRFLTTWALESVISHWDGYAFESRNNYRVYQDPTTGRWTMVSTGIDQTFGHREGSRSGIVDPWNVQGLLAARCLEEADCAAAFATRLEQVNRTFEQSGLEVRVQGLRAELSAEAHADPRAETSGVGFEKAVDETLTFVHERPGRIRKLLDQHR